MLLMARLRSDPQRRLEIGLCAGCRVLDEVVESEALQLRLSIYRSGELHALRAAPRTATARHSTYRASIAGEISVRDVRLCIAALDSASSPFRIKQATVPTDTTTARRLLPSIFEQRALAWF